MEFLNNLGINSTSGYFGVALLVVGGFMFLAGIGVITSLRPVYTWLKDTSGILEKYCRSTDDEINYLYQIIADYWKALADVVPAAFEDPSDYVIQKTPGVFSLHKLLRHLLGDMYRGR
jgi:hypothetical protein